jgi:hypothetical protein
MDDRQPGCLTESEMRVIRDAPPAGAPEALALHLAGCLRCQERLLFGALRAAGPRKQATVWPPWRRLVVLLLCLMAMLVVFVLSLRMLTAGAD